MNMQPVLITMETEHRMGKLKEKETKSFPGIRHEQRGKWYLQFKEALEDGGPEVPSLLVVSDNQVRLHRKGDYGGDLVFQCGQCRKSEYRTPMGVLELETVTSRIDVFVSEEKLEIELRYDLFSQGELISKVAMTICAR